MKLSGKGNPAHEIVDVVADGLRKEEFVEYAKTLLDLTLNDFCLDEHDRARMVGKICFRFGLDPPEEIKLLIF